MNECRRKRNDAVIVFEQKKRKMSFFNPEKRMITEVHVDGCEITEGDKCDYLLIEHDNTEHFVELKGGDILHACRQILASHQQLSRKPSQVFAWITSSRVPQIDSNIQKVKRELERKNVRLTIKNSQQSYQLP